MQRQAAKRLATGGGAAEVVSATDGGASSGAADVPTDVASNVSTGSEVARGSADLEPAPPLQKDQHPFFGRSQLLRRGDATERAEPPEQVAASPSPEAFSTPMPKRPRRMMIAGGIEVLDVTKRLTAAALPVGSPEREDRGSAAGASDTCSIASTALKDMNKHERCIATAPLNKAFAGRNISADISKLRRAATVAEKEGFKDWENKIESHLSFLVAAANLYFEGMQDQKIEDTQGYCLTLIY